MKAKIFMAGLAMMLLGCAGCTHSYVEFSYFNLSQHDIWVTDVAGVPEDASPGRLKPVPDEERISENTAYFFKTVRVADKVRIIWQESGLRELPNGKQVRGAATHEVELTRDQLGVPPKVQSGELRLTYLGKDRWFGAYFEE